MKNSEMCVSLQSLALPGENGDVSPAVGDEVDFSGTAAISRIEGEGPEAKAYLTPKTINGEPINADKPKAAPSMEDEEAEMREEAQKQDRLY